MIYRITPPLRIPCTSLQLPASKSISNRVLIIDALGSRRSTIENLSLSDDTKTMQEALSSEGDIDIGPAGTAMRFLTAYLAQKEGNRTITGSERMKLRPIKTLVEALQQLGAEIQYTEKEGFPPLKITGRPLKGGNITLAGDISSQYISALMMIAPYMENGLEITISSRAVSQPYIDMTATLMNTFGVEVQQRQNKITIPPSTYSPVKFQVESDWSAASYHFQIAALAGNNHTIRLHGLTDHSLQGDSRVVQLFSQLGVNTTFTSSGAELQNAAIKQLPQYLEHNFIDTPDIAQTLAVTACLLGIKFNFTGLQSLRIKETDRLEALRIELQKLGHIIEIHNNDTLRYLGQTCPPKPDPIISTYHDHRMAMAFAPACLRTGAILIDSPQVVTKSYPTYWKNLSESGFEINEQQ
jgi:3-phosphoshikimate 1-carboxyvinyltransferase